MYSFEEVKFGGGFEYILIMMMMMMIVSVCGCFSVDL